MGNILNQKDFVGAGFQKLDDTLIEQHPPKISWGMLYRDKMSQREKIQYLERIASAMNHAAAMIQKERDALNILCGKKERQLVTMQKAVAQNNEMLQSEVTRLNEDRQNMLQEIARLKNKLR